MHGFWRSSGDGINGFDWLPLQQELVVTSELVTYLVKTHHPLGVTLGTLPFKLGKTQSLLSILVLVA